MKEVKLKTNDLLGLNRGLGFILEKELKDTGVELTWDAVTATSTIKTDIEGIQTLADKINQQYFKTNEKTGVATLIEEAKDAFDKAKEELESKEFTYSLPQVSFDKLKKIPGITGTVLLQLKPLISR